MQRSDARYEGLPVVWVRDWANVTPALLERERRRVRRDARAFNMNRVYWPYWLAQLTRAMEGGGEELAPGGGGGGGGRRAMMATTMPPGGGGSGGATPEREEVAAAAGGRRAREDEAVSFAEVAWPGR